MRPAFSSFWRCFILSIGCAAFYATSPLARSGELQAGASAVKITPPLGVPMAGYYHERSAEAVHDDLYAKAIVIEKDGVRAAFVGLDLISTTRPLIAKARKAIDQTCAVPGSNVMISATHAHTGPILADNSARVEALGGNNQLAREYADLLPKLVAESVRQAEANMVPVRAFAATGREATLPFNRRFFMQDGAVGWNPGKLNPKIVRPAGPIDPAVPVVYFEAKTSQPVAVYVNYAMHLDTVGGLQISADYPYTLSRLLGDWKGNQLITLFTIGTAGDINHVDVQWSDKQKGPSEAARIGAILAAAVLKTFPRLSPVADGPLQSRSKVVKLGLPPIQPGEVDKSRELVARRGRKEGPEPSFLETVHAFKVLDVDARAGAPQEVEVQVISLGPDLAWVSLPGEIFVELGLAIKTDSPFRHTIIAELANGSIGYIPTRRAWPQGNYEVISARCAEGSGELLVETALSLLNELHRK